MRHIYDKLDLLETGEKAHTGSMGIEPIRGEIRGFHVDQPQEIAGTNIGIQWQFFSDNWR